jgi:hypothetical protein
LNAQSYHLLNLIGHGSALSAIASRSSSLMSLVAKAGRRWNRLCVRR